MFTYNPTEDLMYENWKLCSQSPVFKLINYNIKGELSHELSSPTTKTF